MIVAQPDSIEGVSALLCEASAQGKRVSVVGGGTHMQCGRPPASIDIELHTGRLDSVAAYTPEDMTISVQAGMTASRLSALLMEHGCRLPLDVEEPDRSTIGGIAAVGWSGPRCSSLGNLRDLLIGARVVLADGTIVKTGGMVVKNVSGYDLTKLLHGSLGSLGVIVELNFKLLPIPAREVMQIFHMGNGAEAMAAASALRRSQLPFAAIDASSAGAMAVGCEGHPADVERLFEAARAVASRIGGREADRAEGSADTTRAWRQRIAAPFEDATVTMRIASRLSRLTDDVGDVQRIAGAAASVFVWRADFGCGSLDVSLNADGTGAPIDTVERSLIERFGSVRVLRCPERLRSSLAIFGRPPQGLPLMRALKAQFDPNGVLNVGTNVGGI